jgi:hypothetical protein
MIDPISQTIKLNCDISDARFWGHFSICGLLMRYRDLYRSEKGLEPWSPVPRQDIASWIERKEAQWPELEQKEFDEIPCGGKTCTPYDTQSLNELLNPLGYVYGAGLGMYLKPTFFLGGLRSITEIEGHQVFVSDRELVRDLFSAPAMLQDRSIFIRFDPLRALLWDAFSRIRPGCGSILAEAFAAAGISAGQRTDDAFTAALERMAQTYADVLLWHELAESRERDPRWKELIAAAKDRNAELLLRAIQDLVADTSERGPLHRIIKSKETGALAAMAGLLDGFRRALFPEIREACRLLLREGNWEIVENARSRGYERFNELRNSLLEVHSREGRDALIRSLQQLAASLR